MEFRGLSDGTRNHGEFDVTRGGAEGWMVVGCDAAEHPHDHLARGNQETGTTTTGFVCAKKQILIPAYWLAGWRI